MHILQFTVWTIPIAQPRQRNRVVVASGRAYSMNYTPVRDPVNAFKASVRLEAAAVAPQEPIQGPLGLSATFVLPRPRAMIWKTRPMPRVCHVGRPDVDNLVKSLTDAMSGLIFRDDSQVCVMSAAKVIASGTEKPHVAVTLRWGDDVTW